MPRLHALQVNTGYWHHGTLTSDCLNKFLRITTANCSRLASFRYAHKAPQSLKIRGAIMVDRVRIPTIRDVEIQYVALLKETLVDILEGLEKETQRRHVTVTLTGLDRSKCAVQALLEHLAVARPDSLRDVSLSLCVRLRPRKAKTGGGQATVEQLKDLIDQVKARHAQYVCKLELKSHGRKNVHDVWSSSFTSSRSLECCSDPWWWDIDGQM